MAILLKFRNNNTILKIGVNKVELLKSTLAVIGRLKCNFDKIYFEPIRLLIHGKITMRFLIPNTKEDTTKEQEYKLV